MAARDARPDFTGTRRYEVVRVVGAGGMGVVYEAFDRERKGRVALKTLRTLDADARLRFKNEFRSLQDIQHPNLVSLGELHEERGQLFFTMELVRGVDFVVHVRVHEEGDGAPSPDAITQAAERPSVPPPSTSRAPTPMPRSYVGRGFDEARLRAALAQLVQGLMALHGAQKVHRDIKPSNVLVTAEGRVVILDFGLVADASREDGGTSIVGTAHFMAPEQVSGKPVGPEADLYSVGVMLYLALTGAYPFQFAPKVVMDMKRRVEPPPPGQLVQGLPPDLEQLCVDLLRIDPAARPTSRDVLRGLQVEEPDEEPPVISQRFGFVGRRRELAALDEALADASAGRTVVQVVEGESGVGKSALLRRFVERIAGDALVLAARCYERESVPYKAVDGLVDALSDHLSILPAADVEALLPQNAGLLGTVFPVLRKVGAIVDARAQRSAVDPPEIRALVFAAMRELFRRLSAAQPLVLALDDLQWADADSLALLSEILRPSGVAGELSPRPASAPDLGLPPPRPSSQGGGRSILLIAAIRSGSEASAVLSRRLSIPADSQRHVTLDRLSSAEAQELCALLLRGAGPERSISVEALAEEAGGHPLFIDALVRHRLAREDQPGPLRLDDVLWARIGRLEPRARQILELMAVAGRPILLEVAAHAAAAELGEVTRLLAGLRAAHLVRTGGAGREEFLEAYHHRIRETVAGRLDPQVARDWHGRLALALEASGRGELDALAEHWCAAGDAARAAGYAVRAAEQAEAALAFDRAARLYRMAIDLQPEVERRARLVKLGDALSSAGRGAKAAEAYMAASDGAPDAEALELGRRAAENLLRAGYVDAGLAGLRTVLAAVGMQLPKTPERAYASLLFRRAQARLRGLRFEERDAATIPPEDLTRIDVCWSAALGLAIVDPVRGADFQTRNLLLALKAGEPYRVARALAFEAAYAASEGAAAAPRVSELLGEAGAIAERIERPHALGLVELVRGMAGTLLGRFRDAARALDRAETIFSEHCTGVAWERGSMHAFSVWALWYLGEVREFAGRVPLYLQAAEERGDLYLATTLRSSQGNAYWLVQGEPELALEEHRSAIRSWSKAGFHLQAYFDLVARAQIGLYRGDGDGTYRLFTERWAGLEASLALRIQAVRVSLLHLRACAALAAVATSADPAALLQDVVRTARKLEGEHAPWADAFAIALRAGAAAARGEREPAAELLASAAQAFEAADMALYAAAAHRRRGELVLGDEGRAAVAEASRWMKDEGVVDPERMTAMLLPLPLPGAPA